MSLLDELRDGTIDVKTFLSKQNEKIVQNRLLSNVDEEYETIKGSYMYDNITPNTFEFTIAYMAMRQLIQILNPETTYGEFLKGWAAAFGVPKNEAEKASGQLRVIGNPGTLIPNGTISSNTIPQNSANPPKYFIVIGDYTIPESGEIFINIVAEKAGVEGNVGANEINILITKTIMGITSITNPAAITNGTPTETDASLKQRWFERAQNPPSSGNKADYVRWAREIPNVDEVVVDPIWAGPGTVKLTILTDGGAASPDTITAVKNHIDPYPYGQGGGTAPVGAIVSVFTVEEMKIDVQISNIIIADGANTNTVKDKIRSVVDTYIKSVSLGGIVRFVKVEAAVGIIDEVLAVEEVKMKVGTDEEYQQSDIQLDVGAKASVKDVFYV